MFAYLTALNTRRWTSAGRTHRVVARSRAEPAVAAGATTTASDANAMTIHDRTARG
jgi:hypothetical protein